MRLNFFCIKTSHEDWLQQAQQLYLKKINHFYPMDVTTIKSKALDREHGSKKIQLEAAAILKKSEPQDYLILFDEKGRSYKDSIEFSKDFSRALESGKPRVVFLIGGAFGVSEDIKKRAQMIISLSSLTMNHHVAQVIALEQIYRALTLIKGRPYHNQ